MKLAIDQTRPTENDVLIIRKLLEQIHNYFEYLECPYYSSELSERDLLLLLIQPSLKRYKLIEWMLNRLEPELDFYLPREFGKCNENVSNTFEKKEAIDAIAYLKNLGLCYSRVMVPDIIHARVGPLIQLKFLVRLLRGIRLKSWNRRPVVRRGGDTAVSITASAAAAAAAATASVSNTSKKTGGGGGSNSDDEVSPRGEEAASSASESCDHGTDELLKYISGRIARNHTARTLLTAMEHHLDTSQIANLKDRLYLRIMDRMTVTHPRGSELGGSQPEPTGPETRMSLHSENLSFLDGIIQLLVDEVLSNITNDQKDDNSCSSVCCFSDDYESYCSLTVRGTAPTNGDSASMSGSCSTTAHQSLRLPVRNNANSTCTVTDHHDQDQAAQKISEAAAAAFRSYTTSINLQKQTFASANSGAGSAITAVMGSTVVPTIQYANGDDAPPLPKPRNCKFEELSQSSYVFSESHLK